MQHLKLLLQLNKRLRLLPKIFFGLTICWKTRRNKMGKSKTNTKAKVIGTILTLLGVAGVIYAAMCQFMDGMDRRAAAGILLFSIVITFIGIGQLYKKHPDHYGN